MRFVEIAIPTGKRETVLETLDEEGIDHVVTEETSGREITAVVAFPLPTEAVEPTLDRLRSAGLSDDAFTVVMSAETVVSRRFEELQERYDVEESEDRIAREEIRSRARDLAPSLSTFVAMSVVSVVVATAGVLLNSAAVVVGSMVIAPLIGPAMSTSVGTVLQDRDLFVEGVRLQVLGFVLAIATAAAFAWFLKTANLVPLRASEVLAIDQVRERLAPDILSLAVALGAGVAGAYSLSSGISTSLVGVAIAVALVPPTAVVGIGIAWGLPALVVGSTVLVLVNFLSINLAALVFLWYQGYRPEHWFHEEEARSATIKRVAALAIAILLLSTFLGAVTYSSYQTAAVENEVREDLDAVLSRVEFEGFTVIDVRVETGEGIVFRQPEEVIVTVGRPVGSESPGLAEALAERIDGNRHLDVAVRYVEIERAGG